MTRYTQSHRSFTTTWRGHQLLQVVGALYESVKFFRNFFLNDRKRRGRRQFSRGVVVACLPIFHDCRDRQWINLLRIDLPAEAVQSVQTRSPWRRQRGLDRLTRRETPRKLLALAHVRVVHKPGEIHAPATRFVYSEWTRTGRSPTSATLTRQKRDRL